MLTINFSASATPEFYHVYGYGLQNCNPISSLKDAWVCTGAIPLNVQSEMISGIKQESWEEELHHTVSIKRLKEMSTNELCCKLPANDGSSNPILIACEMVKDYPNGGPWCDKKGLLHIVPDPEKPKTDPPQKKAGDEKTSTSTWLAGIGLIAGAALYAVYRLRKQESEKEQTPTSHPLKQKSVS